MDYPKSVPGVGLVDGKFVDEDQVNGTPGSLIPATWGNAVTDEILGVLAEADVAPAEANNGQLRESILAIALKVVQSVGAQATELVRGALRIGTQAEVDAGTLDNVAVTPKKLRWGLSVSLTTNGYIVFPTWLGGLIIQWGSHQALAAGASVAFPIAFPAAVFSVAAMDFGLASSRYVQTYNNLSKTGFTVYGGSNEDLFSYIAIGH